MWKSFKISLTLYFLSATILSCSSQPEESCIVTPPNPIILRDIDISPRIIVDGTQCIPFPKAMTALSYPLISTEEALAQKMLLEIEAGLRYVLQTENKATLCVHGTGTTALQAVMDNLVEVGDRVLIPSYGEWAEHAAEAVRNLGGETIVVRRERGTSFRPEEVIVLIQLYRPDIVVLVSGDSTGQKLNMEGIGDACRLYDCLVVADIVRVLGNQAFFMDKLGIDAVYAGVHKGIGATAGLGVISFSERAVEKALSRTDNAKNWLYDMKRWMRENYWHIASATEVADAVHSFSIPVLYSLREALNRIAVMGLTKRWELVLSKHAELRRKLKEEIPTLEFYGDPENWLIADVYFHPPIGRNNTEVTNYILKKHGISVGSLFEGMCRISMIGYGPDLDLVESIVKAVNDAWVNLEVSD